MVVACVQRSVTVGGRGCGWCSAQITDYLYLGGEDATSDRSFLADTCSIKYILNCTRECRNHFPDQFSYMRVEVADDGREDLRPHFTAAHEFIQRAHDEGACVLVRV